MSSAAPHDWSTDLTSLCQVLGERLRREGRRHAWAAAVALAVRGRQGSDRTTFAHELGLDEHELGRIEAGDVPFDRFPGGLVLLAAHTDGLDLDALPLTG